MVYRARISVRDRNVERSRGFEGSAWTADGIMFRGVMLRPPPPPFLRFLMRVIHLPSLSRRATPRRIVGKPQNPQSQGGGRPEDDKSARVRPSFVFGEVGKGAPYLAPEATHWRKAFGYLHPIRGDLGGVPRSTERIGARSRLSSPSRPGEHGEDQP